MPLDALCITAVRNELAGQIQGMKIDKIQQPERDVIILSLRGNGGQTHKLLVSVGSGDTRIHLTGFKFDNPQTPPMFCMLLRKHITGARIVNIMQPPSERVLIIKLDTVNAMGVEAEKSIIVEMIGSLSNIILTDSNGLIIDCLRRIGGELNEKRAVLPGLLYRQPQAQAGKIDPLDVTESQFNDLIKTASNETADKWLISTFTALSPLICRELVWLACGDTDQRICNLKDNGAALKREFFDFIGLVKRCGFEPWLISSADKKPVDFSFTQIKQYEGLYETKHEECFSGMLDMFFTCRAQEQRISQRSAATLKTMTTARDRLVRKLAVQKTELTETSKRDHLRESGDIITANLHTMKKGQQLLIADDFFSPDGVRREIQLDPVKTPQQNAAKYYKAYTKAKNAGHILVEQIKNGEKELEYTESVIEQIKRAENESDLNDILSELSLTGYIRKKSKQKQQKGKQTESLPHMFKSTSGMKIFAGKNNMQNDRLTLRSAAKTDIWLHTQKIQGAHVIISCDGKHPDEITLNEAASIAAYYSAARTGGKIPVDYTQVRNVKKPSGGRPGMVIYNDYQTITAVPDEDLIIRLRVDD